MMEFQHPITEAIAQRKSCRSFEQNDIDAETLKKLSAFLSVASAQTNGRARFILVKAEGKSGAKLGTYGMITGANNFIAGIAKENDVDEVDLGYQFERILLYATELGLGTCWLGGTFSRSDFAAVSHLTQNEYIPIVSPVGNGKEKPRFLEGAMRRAIGADNRKPWAELFFHADGKTPLAEDEAGEYRIPLEMVRLGPSASNKQPWRVTADKKGYHFHLSRTKGYGLEGYDMQKNDMGIAKCHFELTAGELGLKGQWEEQKHAKAPKDWEYVTSWAPEKN
jgi:hypothetical protein